MPINISVIIICLNEEEHIGDCLRSLIDQTYPKNLYEIIVVDGNSVDKTQDIIQSYVTSHSFIRMVVENKKGAAAARNSGLVQTAHDHIAFIDADCEAPADWLSILAGHLEKSVKMDSGVIGVGGRNIPPPNADKFVEAIGIAMDHFIGSFNSPQGRQFKKKNYVHSLSNLNVLYIKKPLMDIGGYDESLKSEAEDADINFRLSRKGDRFLYIPESFVWHKLRPTPGKWFLNMFRYGKGRARLLKRHPDMWRISYVLPLLFLIFFAMTALNPYGNFLLFWLIYLPLVFIIAARQVMLKKSHRLWFHTTLVYIIQHFGYALGEAFGLISPRIK